MPCLGTVLGLELLLFLDFSGAETEDQARTGAMVLVGFFFFCSRDVAEGQIKFYGKRKNHRESMFLADLMAKLPADFRRGRFLTLLGFRELVENSKQLHLLAAASPPKI